MEGFPCSVRVVVVVEVVVVGGWNVGRSVGGRFM